MFHIRTVKTSSGATAVQVIRYLRRKRIVVKHIGSAHKPQELITLKNTARNWIERHTCQQHLFPPEKKKLPILSPWINYTISVSAICLLMRRLTVFSGCLDIQL